MNTKKLLLATLASFVVMLVLGGVVNMYVLHDWYMNNAGPIGDIMRKEPMIQYIALGNLLLAFIMSYLYPKGVESDNKMMEGLKFGVIMGILWVVPHGLVMYGATTVFSGKIVLMNAVEDCIIQGIGGIIIAYIYGADAKAK